MFIPQLPFLGFDCSTPISMLKVRVHVNLPANAFNFNNYKPNMKVILCICAPTNSEIGLCVTHTALQGPTVM